MSENQEQSDEHSPEVEEIARILESPTVYDLSDSSPEHSSREKRNSSSERDRTKRSRSLEQYSIVRQSTSSEQNKRARRSTSSQRSRRVRSSSSERDRRVRQSSPPERDRRLRRSISLERDRSVRRSRSSERDRRVRRRSPSERDGRVRRRSPSERDRRARWSISPERDRRVRHSSSSERDRLRYKRPIFCRHSERRFCIRLRVGRTCNAIHLDDNPGYGGEAGQDHDDEEEDDDDDKRQRKEREWQNEKAPRDKSPGYDVEVAEDKITQSYVKPKLHKVESQKTKTVCKLYELGLCYNGKNCTGDHSNQNAQTERTDERVCIYYIRGLCKRTNCKFAHPEADLRKVVDRQVWLKVCKRFQQQMCDTKDCSYLHVNSVDEDMYKRKGLISELVLGQAIRKVLRLDIPIQGAFLTCKDKLNGDCNIVNCPFLHITRKRFIQKVLDKVRMEFVKFYGESRCIFQPVEEQNKIIERLLDPNASDAPVTTAVVPFMPPYMGPMPICPPPPMLNPMMIGLQPAVTCMVPPQPLQPTEEEDIDKVLARKLECANKKLAEENEKYMKYVETLEKENFEIKRILDPEQPAEDLDDIRSRILKVFENIYWKKEQQLMEKSVDYQHKSEKEKPTEQNEVSPRPQIPVEIASGVPPIVPQLPMGPYSGPPPQVPLQVPRGPYPGPYPQAHVGPYATPPPHLPRGPPPQIPRGQYPGLSPQVPSGPYPGPSSQVSRGPYPTSSPSNISNFQEPYFSRGIGRSDSYNMPNNKENRYNNKPSCNTLEYPGEDNYNFPEIPREDSHNFRGIPGEDDYNFRGIPGEDDYNLPKFSGENNYNFRRNPEEDDYNLNGIPEEDNYNVEPMEMM